MNDTEKIQKIQKIQKIITEIEKSSKEIINNLKKESKQLNESKQLEEKIKEIEKSSEQKIFNLKKILKKLETKKLKNTNNVVIELLKKTQDEQKALEPRLTQATSRETATHTQVKKLVKKFEQTEITSVGQKISPIISPTNKIHKLKILIDDHFKKINIV
jgi:predicted  nucleic acid-binding Zn-ribbon protein